ncbi:MAG: TIGR04076 family protein [Clostridia bacterium]|nr:TIGR04076 family protein [Clostridia bacterium]MBQ5905283.1 TIGR04076 family protein [Clostridia bacterium]
MKKVKITAVRKAEYTDLMEKYEKPIEHACDIKEGDVFIANGWERPEGFCLSAWESISPFVLTLSHGGGNFYNGWMKNPFSAMISCNDGFRPVSFYLEVLNEDIE